MCRYTATREWSEPAASAEIDAAQFFAVDIRVGTVVQCETFPEARRPAYRMVIDFGPLGTMRSSARLTDLYTPERAHRGAASSRS